jgi:hypothetical protein
VAGGNWALAPLIVTNIAATASNGAPAGPDFGQSGSLLLIAAQPSLQASVANGSALVLTLYGNPGSNYTVVTATNLAPPITWTVLTNLTLTNAVQAINAGPATNSMEFFAIQTVTPAPPALAASLGVGASFVLTLYGNAGSSYAILAATNLAPPVAWTTLTNVTLTNAIQVINPGPLTNSMEFFSAQQQ